MSARGKTRVVAVLVAAVALWPLAHRALATRCGIDPWELFGWAMYAAPEMRFQVGIEAVRGGGSEPLPLAGESRAALRRFARRRSALGCLASPRPLGHRVLAEEATLDAVVVVIRAWYLDPESARLGHRDERIVVAREPAGAVVSSSPAPSRAPVRRPGS